MFPQGCAYWVSQRVQESTESALCASAVTEAQLGSLLVRTAPFYRISTAFLKLFESLIQVYINSVIKAKSRITELKLCTLVHSLVCNIKSSQQS